MKMNSKQIEAVMALPGAKRFEHFIKVIADREEVWGLYQKGWALAAAEDGTEVFPFWPYSEYAQLCAENEWNGYSPQSISLKDFIEVLLPKLKNDGVLLGIFFTPSSKGLTPTVDELLIALTAELQNY